MTSYIVHDQPAGRAATDYLAIVDLEPFGFEPSWEQLWLRAVGSAEYELCCLPFRVYGLALGDLVSLDATGKLVQSLVKPAGHRLFRVFLKDEATAGAPRDRIQAAIAEGGLIAEWSGDRHVAIHVPDGHGPDGSLWAAVEEFGDDAVWEWADVEPFQAG